MGATFVVTLREAFEAALLLGIVYTYLDKIGARAQTHYVTIGGALGLLASVAMGVALTYLSGPLLDIGPDLVATVVIFGAVALLTWHGWWMRRHASAARGQIERRLEEARENRRLWVVGLIAFTGVFREGAETVLFLWGLLAEASVSGSAGIAGGALGVAVAAVLGWLIFHGGRRISLRTFFASTSALLLLVAAGLFSAGLGKLQAFGWLPGGDPLWDTSGILSDRGVIGGMLGGIVGYRARPSAIEFAGWLLYLVAAGWLIFRGASRAQDATAPVASPTR
jgi:high-affinity iron transporter